MEVLQDKGVAKRAIARTLEVTEGTVCYHLRRRAVGAVDGRRDKPFRARKMSAVIDSWVRERADAPRPVNVMELYEHLSRERDYTGSYQSVRRYVRACYGQPRIRTYRRVETPPGAQAQTDWGEYPQVDVGAGPERLHAFVMVLSHSRKPAIVWSEREDEVSWLACHNGAFRRLGGIPAVNRIDNVRTAIVSGAGAWGVIHPSYRAYARSVGFHIDACQPREANAKGKTEAKVRLSRLLIDVPRARYEGIAGLQSTTDEQVERWATRAICPATGETVQESWQAEIEHLAPLPMLPEPFDVSVERPVYDDGTVYFEGRQYVVPFALARRQVEVRGCASTVQILHQDKIVREYPRKTAQRLLIDPSCYDGEPTERALPPPPLGRMGRRLQEILEMLVAQRPIDLYAALAEVAR